MSEPFVAEIRIFPFNFAPRGWAFCRGQLLPIAQNTALFSLLGITFGGDGRTTFGLPDLQCRAALHPGRGPGLTSRRLGEKGGSETVMLIQAQMPAHAHTMKASTTDANSLSPQGRSLARSQGAFAYQVITNTNVVNISEQAIGNAGANQSHNNLQPFLSLNYCIALVGLYPPRG